MSDVNGLKLVNDSFGHHVGDKLLRKSAELMQKGCRADDILARVGGDEFIFLLPKTSSEEAIFIISRIRELLASEKIEDLELSLSFGYHTKTIPDERINEVLKKAEDGMVKNKITESPRMKNRSVEIIMEKLFSVSPRERKHALGVSKLCRLFGAALGFNEEENKELERVSFLHDIGKIAVSPTILVKPGELTQEEWDEIRLHPEIGYRLLLTVPSTAKFAEAILYHHERWDGSGYPKGLSGASIPLMSRIIAIAEAYDAITTKSIDLGSSDAYETAFKELSLFSGSQFDPVLLNVFLKAIERIDRNG
jgi:diguanylate cyclase (GGDEF)-like protein